MEVTVSTTVFNELFAGIGGFAAAARGYPVRIAAAWDQDETARRVYALHHDRTPHRDNLAGIPARRLTAHPADGWWLSPPCQPYTAKGRGRDDQDPRAAALLHLVDLLPALRPRFLMVENVPPFAQSRCRDRLLAGLEQCGLTAAETLVCPTELGIPNARRRYYLLARPTPLAPRPPLPRLHRPLAAYLDPQAPQELYLRPHELARLDPARDVVDPAGIAGVFGSSYGRALHAAGSYLDDGRGIRRFSPGEILRLLHFPAAFRFPDDMPLRTQYRLAGNSVNVAVVEWLLGWLLAP
jgi:DNA (cytosine-5)-methyltransferase 1